MLCNLSKLSSNLTPPRHKPARPMVTDPKQDLLNFNRATPIQCFTTKITEQSRKCTDLTRTKRNVLLT